MTSSAAAYTESRERMASKTLFTSSNPSDVPASIQDDAAYLNGVLLTVNEQGLLPWENGAIDAGKEVTDASTPIVLPPFSYGFIEYHGANPKGC